MKNPLVSVIIPMYNTGESCLELIKVLKKSSYKNIEIICVDDGSTDDSYKIIRDFAKNDKRIVLKKQKNAGASAARNTGLTYANGDWVSFVDSDDLVDETFIEKLIQAYDDKTIIACTALLYKRLAIGTEKADFMKRIRSRKKNESVKEYFAYSMLQDGRFYGVVNKLFRRDIIKEFGLTFDVSLDFAEDTKFILEYVDAAIRYYPADCKIKFIYEPLYIYNFGTETSVVSKSALDWNNWRRSFRNFNRWSKDQKTLSMYSRKSLLWCRWRISHALSVARSNISSAEKKKYLSAPELAIAQCLLRIR